MEIWFLMLMKFWLHSNLHFHIKLKCVVFTVCCSGNPGNNLHVSGLSNRVDTRDLEAAFAKVGRVSNYGSSVLPVPKFHACTSLLGQESIGHV